MARLVSSGCASTRVEPQLGHGASATASFRQSRQKLGHFSIPAMERPRERERQSKKGVSGCAYYALLSGHSQAAPRTPLESPWIFFTIRGGPPRLNPYFSTSGGSSS